ncbi:MAG: GNAT family N-acetyltransferase [Clostridia bacterium]|jgi:GNAT superfamily N-acetyltransferase|nr:GNAT family N-acetyltransferase [Clostridia bacterium]
MVLLKEYINNPCRSLSIPYWKQKSITVPDNIKIVHNDEYNAADFDGYIDEPYFRLYHDLQTIQSTSIDDVEIVMGAVEMIDVFVNIINRSYCDLSVTKEQIENYRNTPVYSPDLWVVLKEKKGDYVGCGIADYDKIAGELILEWIQVIPSCRGRGYGQYIVNALLSRARQAKFATVSGKVNNTTHPEKMYRKCGFKGNDIWHILRKMNPHSKFQ